MQPSTDTTPTSQLAQRIAKSSYQAIPHPAAEVAKQAIMDFIGVAIAGIDEPLSRILIADALEAGGNPQAQLIGASGRFSMLQAALINGSAGHAHDYDDVHMAMSGHPTVPVAPAALALAEHLHKSGKDLINAFATGVDVECILGRYAGPAHYETGWHNTGTLGTFGAAAAAASLLQLDAATTTQALGIAGTQAAGLKSQFGTMCKPLHAGHAAATGLHSSLLARRGFSSCDDILGTAQGFMATQSSSASLERFEKAMLSPAYTQDICFKYHAACYLTHSSIEATLQLCQSNAFDPHDIVEIEVQVNEGHFGVCNILEPETGLEAKFSLRLTTAMALCGADTASIAIFDDELPGDPEILAFRDRVRVTAHPTPNPESIVIVRTRDGVEHRAADNVANPMQDLSAQWTKLERKFTTLTAPVIGAAATQNLIESCRNLEQIEDMAVFCKQLESSSGTTPP